MPGTGNGPRREKIERFVKDSSKSTTLAIVYALVYGPLGCIYTNPKSAVVAVFVAIALAILYWPLVGLVWIACIAMAPFQVRAYNARLKRQARYLVV